jgi:integral membrane protein TerC family protein/prolipoprotein diacylglyceryl transferase
MAWVIVWVGLGLGLGLWVDATQGRSAATEYFAAYLLEESLSVDHIFVFVVIFSELHIPAEHQRRVLLFGVVGALMFRALAIGAGITLIERVQWIIYPFATLILFAAWRLLFGGERERKVVTEACDVCATWIARVVRVSPVLHGHDFWRRESGRLAFFGGLFGAVGAAYVYASRARLRFAPLAALFAPAIPIAAAVGRVACGLDGWTMARRLLCHGPSSISTPTATHRLMASRDTPISITNFSATC